ncbi:MAG: LLM class flavin-dependent oxidoreductase [Actinomycetota bacterium]|nr:LLM class flavin-dependent oxidoreductase [Actinomycetota bacterium]MDH5313476.1 LLM class flavin-dependent oxidoreductase [Actinomycetota bacterium]
MRLGVSLPVFTDDAATSLTVATRARALGVDGVFAPDHLFPPAFYPPSGSDRPALEAFSLLSAVAALEPGLHVGTLVTRITLRAPGMLAKQAAALDAMTDGRAILGIGTGDKASADEHRRFGFPFPPAADRVAALEETVEALHALFGGRTWPGGAHVPPLEGPLLPPGEPPIWVGGLSEAVLGVAARVADAWNGWGLDAEGFAGRASTLRALADGRTVAPTWAGIALVGEDRADLERLLEARAARGLSLDGVWSGTADEWRAFVDRLRDAGATWCVVLPAGPADRLDVIAAATPR